MFTKKNFQIDEKVRFTQTGDHRLDGRTGSILGKSMVHVMDFYIVLFDQPINGYSDKAIAITEACLEKV